MQKCQIHKFVFDTLLTSLLRGPMAPLGEGVTWTKSSLKNPNFWGGLRSKCSLNLIEGGGLFYVKMLN